jgi:putative ABC transport system permease protein
MGNMHQHDPDDTRDKEQPPAWRRYLTMIRMDPARDVDEEIAFHLETAEREFIAAGDSPERAKARALQQFGDVNHMRRRLTEMYTHRERRMNFADRLAIVRQDVRFGLRQLRRSRGFTLAAVVTLALGIGMTSALFSVVDAVLLRPMPFADAERVLRISQRNGTDKMWSIPFGNFLTWQREATAFEAMGATWGPGLRTLVGRGDPASVATIRASAGYWRTLRLRPVLGRYFDAEEDRAPGTPVAVLSEALWRQTFAADSGILGQSIVLDGKSFRVVGVAPDAYIVTPPAEALWVPLAPAPSRASDFKDHELNVYGLVWRGVAPAVAIRQLEQIDTRLAQENPHALYDGGIIAPTLGEDLVGDFRRRLYMLLGAAAIVLLIACGNNTNLLLAQAMARRTEIAVRGALGASRRRIILQFVTEAIMLATAAGILGLAVAYAGIRFLTASPVRVPRLQLASLDPLVVTVAFGLALACAIVSAVLPAIRVSQLDLQRTLRAGTRDSQGGIGRGLREAFVIGELCLSQLLLIAAGLLIRSSVALTAIPAGFDTHNLLAFSVGLPNGRYVGEDRAEAVFQEIDRTLAAVPGVRIAGRAQAAPIYGSGWNWTAMREGSDGHDDGATVADMRYVNQSYFESLQLPLLRGRAFGAGDAAHAPLVAIVSRSLAAKLWPDANPIGKRISNGGNEWREVIGVAGDMRSNGTKEDAPHVLYIPSTQRSNPAYTYLVRGNVPVTTLVPALRRAVASVDASLALAQPSTIDDALDHIYAADRFTRWLLTALGACGLFLSVVGIYGVIAYFVTQRRREMGIRIALGASASSVRWMVVRQGVVMVMVAMAVGTPLALIATRLLRSFVFGVSTHDALTFGGVALLLAAVGVGAALIPARRVARIDPLEALRSEG